MLREFLERGFLPAELPPPFSSRTLSRILDPSGALMPGFRPAQSGRLAEHNLARTGSLRRKLSIPNPLHYAILCGELSANFANVQTVCQSSPYSLSRAVVSNVRAVERATAMSQLPVERTKLRSGRRYVLKTDISRCYPSIYTHSIPWAVHGKAAAKANHGPSLWGYKVDKAVRDAQDTQTIGIPIGPDASFLIAEMVLSDIDKKLALLAPGSRGYRYVDDYEFVFSSIGEGEDFLGKLQSVLNEYELVVNPRKTSIVELPVPANAPWASELSVFAFRKTAKGQATDLIRFIDRSFELFKQFTDENVLKYAVSALGSVAIDQNNWKLFEGYIYQILAIEPGAMPQGLRSILRYKRAGFAIDQVKLEEVLNYLIVRHIQLGHGSEVAWAIWGCIELGIPVHSLAAQLCLDCEDPVVLLLISDALTRPVIPNASGLNLSIIKGRITAQGLYDRAWLFAYEADHRNWHGASGGVVATDPAFALMHARGVSFYDPNATMLALPVATVGSGGASPD